MVTKYAWATTARLACNMKGFLLAVGCLGTVALAEAASYTCGSYHRGRDRCRRVDQALHARYMSRATALCDIRYRRCLRTSNRTYCSGIRERCLRDASRVAATVVRP